MSTFDRVQALDALTAIDQRVRPVTMADRQVLPVLEPLVSLLPGGGLRRGTIVSIADRSGSDVSTTLAMALVAEASGQGSWVAVVGMPELGVVAASELGVALDRLALIPRPAPGMWPTVVAALVDAVDVVVVGPARLRPSDARRVTARARERGAVLVPVGWQWPEAPDLSFSAGPSEWYGLGVGHGHLTSRRVPVQVSGRRDASRLRSVELWLPAAGGGVALVEDPSPRVVPLRPVG